MAELYFKLGQLDNAERVIVTELDSGKLDTSDISQLSSRTKLLQLLAKVRSETQIFNKTTFRDFKLFKNFFKFFFSFEINQET